MKARGRQEGHSVHLGGRRGSWLTGGLGGSATLVVRFCAIGAFTASLDVLVLYALVAVWRVNYLVAAGLSFTIAVLINYWLSILWVFASGKYSRRAEIFLFWTISAGGLGLNQFLMMVLVGAAGLSFMLAKFLSIGVVAVWNYIGKKRLVFDV